MIQYISRSLPVIKTELVISSWRKSRVNTPTFSASKSWRTWFTGVGAGGANNHLMPQKRTCIGRWPIVADLTEGRSWLSVEYT